jgi:hypothetical protein
MRINKLSGIVCIIGVFITQTVFGATILNHMMTKDPLSNTSCATPTSNYTFTLEDETAYSWVQIGGSPGSDSVRWFWYSPDSTLFEEFANINPPFQTFDCTGAWIDIRNNPDTIVPGNWHVDVYYNDVYQYTENFTISSCPAVTLYGNDSEETELLRYLRDNILSNSPEGQELINLYYEWSPAVSEMMEADESFKADVKKLVDGVLKMIK